MNQEYTYIDGKAIISDENGKQTLIEYSDNLDDILVQENVIETMENRISELENNSKLYNRKHYIPIILSMTALMSTIGVNLLSYFLTGNNPFLSSMNTIFGVVNNGVFNSLFYSAFFLPFGAYFEAIYYNQYRKDKRKGKGINSELEFLKKQIIDEKQTLENLKKEKKRNNEDKEFRVVKVDDKKQLQTLKQYLNLYFDLGYNEKKYSKYYQQGKLDDKLKKRYTDTGIEIAKEYLGEKGPTLVKRKK